MISNEDIKNFLQERHPNIEGVSYKRYFLPLDATQKYELKIGKPFEQFNQSDFITLFENNNWTAKNTFTSNKSVISDFGGWYFVNVIGLENIPFGHNKTSSVEHIEFKNVSSEDRYKKEYFKSHDDFLNALDEIFGNEDRYTIHKAFFSFMWYGINRNQMKTIKQDDIVINDEKMTIHLSQKRTEIDDKRTIDAIQNSFKIDGYEAEVDFFGRGPVETEYQFQPTGMFLRKAVRQHEEFTDLEEHELKHKEVPESTISKYYTDQARLADELPEDNEYHGKRMVFRGISDSAAFCRLMQIGRKENITKEEIDKARMDDRDTKEIVAAFNSNYKGWQEHFGYA